MYTPPAFNTASNGDLYPYGATATGALARAAYGGAPAAYTPEALQSMTGPAQGPATYKPDDSAMVSSSLNKLLASDNPYLQQARTRASEYANSRGLLNSSIGAGAGESAAIQAALPIAQADAQSNFTAQRDNAGAVNQFGAAANDFSRTGALAALRAGYDASSQARQLEFQGGQAEAERAQRQALQTQQFGFQGGQAEAERAQRQAQFGQELGFREGSFGQELGLKKDQLGAEIAVKRDTLAADTALRGQDLGIRQQQVTNENANKQAQITEEMQRTYLDARTQLETTQNLDQAGKARAITAMGDWFYNQSLPAIRANYGSPGAWPGPVTAPPDGVAPAPAPDAAPAPVQSPEIYRSPTDGGGGP